MIFFAASHALIKRQDRLLITKRSQLSSYMPGAWDIPGGTIEEYESAEETLYREVREETSLIVEIEKLLFVFTNIEISKGRQTFQLIFKCKYLEGEVKTNEREHDDYAWRTKEELQLENKVNFLEAFIASNCFDEV